MLEQHTERQQLFGYNPKRYSPRVNYKWRCRQLYQNQLRMVPTNITYDMAAMTRADGEKLAACSELEQIEQRIRKVTHEIREIERQLSIVRLIDNKKCDKMAQ